MKLRVKLFIVAGAFALATASAVYAAEIKILNFDFIAPSVPSTADAPSQVGLIVYDSTNNLFMGRSSQSAPNDWQPLSPVPGSQVPTGTILSFAGVTAPTGYLVADGSTVSRTAYSTLFAIIGTAYGSGDGSTTFNVPDLRGRFLRGVDGSTGRDPDAATRIAMNSGGNTGDAVGSLQGDAFQGHWHSTNLPNFVTNSLAVSGSGQARFTTTGGSAPLAVDIITDGVNGTPRVSAETRPQNAYVNYIIKY